MTARHRPEHQLAFVEHRARQQRLAHMGVAEVSKIAHQHVAILDLTFEEVGGALHDPLHGHGLDRQRRIRHRDQIAGVIGDADGEVAAEIDNRCPGRALKGDHHFAPDVLVHAHDDAEGPGIDLAGSLPRLDLGKIGHRLLPLARRGRAGRRHPQDRAPVSDDGMGRRMGAALPGERPRRCTSTRSMPRAGWRLAARRT